MEGLARSVYYTSASIGVRQSHSRYPGQSNLAILGMGTVVGTATTIPVVVVAVVGTTTGTRIPVVAVVGTATGTTAREVG